MQIMIGSISLGKASPCSEFVRLNDAARILGLTQRTVRYHIYTRALTAKKQGCKIWIVHLNDVYRLKQRLEDFHA